MKIKNRAIEQLAQVLTKLGESSDPLLVFFVAMNTQKIQSVLQSIASARKPNAEYGKYNLAHQSLCAQFAVRDAQGAPVQQQMQTPEGIATRFQIQDEERFQRALLSLRQQWAEVLQQRADQLAKIQVILEKESDLALEVLKKSECPEGIITGNIAAILIHLGLLEWDTGRPSNVTVLKEVKEG